MPDPFGLNHPNAAGMGNAVAAIGRLQRYASWKPAGGSRFTGRRNFAKGYNPDMTAAATRSTCASVR